MNRQISRLGIAMLVCYTALFVQLNRVQVFGAQELNDSPVNSRTVQGDFDRPRGTISTADGVIVAESAAEAGQDVGRRRRDDQGVGPTRKLDMADLLQRLPAELRAMHLIA